MDVGVPIISITLDPAWNGMASVLLVDVTVSPKSTSSPSIKTKNSSSPPLIVASNTDLGIARVNDPSSGASTETVRESAFTSGIILITLPSVIWKSTSCPSTLIDELGVLVIVLVLAVASK